MSALVGYALYSDTSCSSSALQYVQVQMQGTLSDCSATTNNKCTPISATGGSQQSICLDPSNLSLNTFATSLYANFTFVAATEASKCTAPLSLDAPVTSSATGILKLYSLDLCTPLPAKNQYTLLSLNASNTNQVVQSTWSDPQCQFLVSSTSLSCAVTSSTNQGVVTPRFPDASCSLPVSLSFKRSPTLFCSSQKTCQYSSNTQAYLASTCIQVFDPLFLKGYIDANNLIQAGPYSIIWAFADTSCTAPRNALVTYLDQCVPQKSTQGNITVLSKTLSLSPTNGSLLRTRYLDSGCLIYYDTLDYGVPDSKCRNLYSTAVYGIPSNNTQWMDGTNDGSGLSTGGRIGISVVAVFMLVGFCGWFVFLTVKKRMVKKRDIKESVESLEFNPMMLVARSSVNETPSNTVKSLKSHQSDDHVMKKASSSRDITYSAIKPYVPVNVDDI
ncbi:hypothetical protein BCR33DRAFT_763289 [Rhizoclosmatium globosum]|uniref:Uncharacterized protein n=1 Tax=Rhizoclosmatium globosum TaxID=329046 RepID=A0A1Y2CR86_9FUNG|nr:hypothetical protein BCR33DRAFT_763289 [Rhizoclosmatium globosum]|eukprot:ORY49541.1 hypothetical protein BCR33DRAFT_763289 [Rhizoclosmatium globosum]